jgi:hypothetical protein
MKRTTILVAAIVAVCCLGAWTKAQNDAPSPAAGKLRVGTYDSRAIAVAYAASAFNPVAEKMKEHAAAKAAGDAAKVAELEAWGETHQRMLHFQGFGRVPVKDLLEHVRAGVTQIAADERLAIVTMDCDFAGADVEVVDVTEQLVELFKPTERTREMARKVRAAQPVSLTDLADMPANL